jgi:hypothetical protein
MARRLLLRLYPNQMGHVVEGMGTADWTAICRLFAQDLSAKAQLVRSRISRHTKVASHGK